jgi:hypothetical protein
MANESHGLLLPFANTGKLVLAALIETLSVVSFLLLSITTSFATITYNVSFLDPTLAFSSFYDPIRSNVLGAGSEWSRFLLGNASIEVEIRFDSSIPTATGASATNVFVRNNGIFNVLQEGAGAEIATGIDPNALAADAIITLGSTYLANELWFDPNPFSRIDPVPLDKTDAVSVLVHEFGHVFGFNGFRNPFTGVLPGIFGSTYDEFALFNGSDFFFFGPNAQQVYGAPVPLTFGNYTHVGNSAPRPGTDLIPDLMNGVVFFRGLRYEISSLDLAILSDVGVPVTAVPEAPGLLLMVVGVLLLTFVYRMKLHGRSN